MIHSITCDKESFKNVRFNPGFNVILAERTEESTKKDSRNGLGKSTLIEIIHFCLGGNKGETLSKHELDDWTFTLDIDLAGKRYSVTRNTLANKVAIEGDCSDWPIKPELDKKHGKQIITNSNWKRVLGVLMFGLEPSYDDMKYAPTFRSLISYFIRHNGQSGAFLNPFQHFKNQIEWDKQINNAFLLDLGWEYAARWQVLKDRIRVLDQIKQEAKSGVLANLVGTIGEIEALKIRLESQVRQEEEQLNSFKVHPQYREIENRANELTYKIHELTNANIDEKRLLEHYEKSLQDEVEAKPESVTRVYQEAGLVLPDSIKQRLDEVLSFHKQVVANRKEFLINEIEQIRNAIAKREQQIQSLSDERAELMQILKKHGALEEYTQLQNNHQKTVAELKDVDIKLANLRKFEQGRSAVAVEQEILQQQVITDLNERKTQKERAILLFNSNSQALYQSPGILSIDISKTGFKFNVKIERSGSHGIGNMKIFCYDLMLAQLWSRKENSPGLLVHDSIIFADVDERQKALALEVAAKESERLGFQYICTMNSDNIPSKDFSPAFQFDKYVRLTLTDATEDGGLLGIRF
ncbi:MAG: ABC-three component system protein [bacterium]